MKRKKSWKSGKRGFYWDTKDKQPLCLQSKDYIFNINNDDSITCVYYSIADACKLYRFLKEVLTK